MIEHELQENERLNASIKKKSYDMAVKRLETKDELIKTIFDILKQNAMQYMEEDAEISLDFNSFVSLFNIAMKIESLNISDMTNLHEVEQIFKDGGVDAKNLQTAINTFNVILTSKTDDAIKDYSKELENDNY